MSAGKDLGKSIAMYRKLCDLTQSELAELIDKSKPTINHYENGVNTPPLPVLTRLANIFSEKLHTTVTVQDIITKGVVPSVVNDVMGNVRKSTSIDGFIVDKLSSIESKIDQLLNKAE